MSVTLGPSAQEALAEVLDAIEYRDEVERSLVAARERYDAAIRDALGLIDLSKGPIYFRGHVFSPTTSYTQMSITACRFIPDFS